MQIKSTQIVRLLLWGLFTISIIRLLTVSKSFSPLGLHVTALTAISAFVISLFSEKKGSKLRFNFLSSSILVSISILIVNFFDYWQYSLGFSDNIHGIDAVGYQVINKASLSALCIYISFLVGGTYGNKIFPERKSNNPISVPTKYLEILMLISLLVFYFSTDNYFFHGGYGEIMNSVGISPLSQISLTLIQSFQLSISVIIIYRQRSCNFREYLRCYSPIYYVTLLIFYYLIISAGERGFLIYTGVVFLLTYYVINHKAIKTRTMIILGVMAVLMLNVLGVLRALDGDLSGEKVKQAYAINEERNSDNIFFSSTSELSDVVQTYHVIYAFVDQYTVLYGIGIADQCLGIIPGLRFFLYPLLGIDQTQFSSTALSTRILDKEVGMGTTCVADIYLNVGLIGSLLVFFFIGIFLKRMDRSLYYSSPNFVVMILAIQYVSYGIYIGRSTLLIPINTCAYAILIVFICSIVSKKKHASIVNY